MLDDAEFCTAPEPDNIQWANVGVSTPRRQMNILTVNIIVLACILILAYLTSALSSSKNRFKQWIISNQNTNYDCSDAIVLLDEAKFDMMLPSDLQ